MTRDKGRPPFGAEPQPDAEFTQIHARWLASLQTKMPEGIGRDPIAHHYPETQRAGQVRQCGACRYYIPLTSDLGADWGCCTNPGSEYDREAVFEHWTCALWNLRLETEREQDGRWLAAVPDLPGAMAYGASKEEAARKARSIVVPVIEQMNPTPDDP